MATVLARPTPVATRSLPVSQTMVAYSRLMLLMLLFVAGTGILTLRLVWMGFSGADSGAQVSSLGQVPARADIVDRNGAPLARNFDAYAIAVRPAKMIKDPMDVADQLHAIFPDTSAGEFYRILTSKKGWSYLRRRALPEQVKAVNAIGDVGIEWLLERDRLYPQRTLAAHVLGFTSIDGKGGMGVERAFDARLIDPAQRAKPLVLSIDSRIQAAMEAELFAEMTAQNALGAGAIVMDANTGEILAMASLPVFNPNKLDAAAPEARRNEMVQSVYELGSTFKPLSFAAAMDAGVVTSMARRYDATAPLPVGGFRIRDDHAQNRWMNVPEALVHSSNIVTARVADELGNARMQALYRALEFDRRPSIEFSERAGSLWPSSWGRVTNMTVAYGHGIAVTPLHLASAYAALVNGGVWRPATIQKIEPGDVPEGRRVFSAATSARMRQLLRMIVASGTGRNADAKGYRVGGKTGTAEKPHQGGYAKGANVTTFAAAFPMEAPRYVVLVMMDEPKGNPANGGARTAAYTAAPVVKRFIERAAPVMGIYPDLNRDVDISELMPLLWKAKGEE